MKALRNVTSKFMAKEGGISMKWYFTRPVGCSDPNMMYLTNNERSARKPEGNFPKYPGQRVPKNYRITEEEEWEVVAILSPAAGEFLKGLEKIDDSIQTADLSLSGVMLSMVTRIVGDVLVQSEQGRRRSRVLSMRKKAS